MGFDIFDVRHRRSGRLAMQRVFDAIRGRSREADSQFILAIGVVAVALAFTGLSWLIGKPGSIQPGLYLLSLAVAYCLHTWVVRDAFARLERQTIGEAERSGFAVRKDKHGSSPGYSLAVSRPDDDVWRSDPSRVEAGFAPTKERVADIEPFAWSPGPLVGAILLPRKPQEHLTRQAYRAVLAQRINRLVAAEDEDDARQLIKQVERRDWPVNTTDLTQLGEAMLAGSEWLNDMLHFPTEGIPAAELDHDDELLTWLENDDNLDGFLNEVYHERETGYD